MQNQTEITRKAKNHKKAIIVKEDEPGDVNGHEHCVEGWPRLGRCHVLIPKARSMLSRTSPQVLAAINWRSPQIFVHVRFLSLARGGELALPGQLGPSGGERSLGRKTHPPSEGRAAAFLHHIPLNLGVLSLRQGSRKGPGGLGPPQPCGGDGCDSLSGRTRPGEKERSSDFRRWVWGSALTDLL